MEPGKDTGKNTRTIIERKQSIKLKTIPSVRQTLTSYNRMLKANPLLRYQEAGIDVDALFQAQGNSLKVGTNSTLADSKANCHLERKSSLKDFKKPEPNILMRTQSLKLPKSNGLDAEGSKKSIISKNQPLTNNYFKKPLVNNHGNIKTTVKHETKPIIPKYLSGNKVDQKKSLIEVKAKVNSFPKKSNQLAASTMNGEIKPDQKRIPNKKNPTIRRSLSSDHIQRKKGVSFEKTQAYAKVNISQSTENILSVYGTSNAPLLFSPILEEKSSIRNMDFTTPSIHEKRSICHFTPRSAKKSMQFHASTPAPIEMQRLQERLNKWLKSRGKPLASYHHLRCFGVNQAVKAPSPLQIDEENKENTEVIEETSDSYENLNINTTPESSKAELPVKKYIPEEELAKVSKEAMVELQKLIQEDYPRPQCLGWLELIRDKYSRAVDEPEYWECRAAIEQSVGNVGNAVEFYKTAIIQGAEVGTVDKSLDQLLKKFSLLDISPNKADTCKVDGNKERIIREARTVFKSTIIQFAIQERKLKKINNRDVTGSDNQKKLVATPVRRSTRMSRSAYVSTPGVTLCSSLREMATEEIDFEKNKALC